MAHAIDGVESLNWLGFTMVVPCLRLYHWQMALLLCFLVVQI